MFAYYFQLGLRSLRRNPALTTLVALIIGFGVASSMTSYAVLRAMSGDPIPWKSSRLFVPQIDVWGPASRQLEQVGDSLPSNLTYLDAVNLLRQHSAPVQAALYPFPAVVQPEDPTQKSRTLAGHAVSSAFFAMLDVPFRYGGSWSAKDDDNHAPVVVISQDLNQRLFGGANSMGRNVRVGEHDYRVAGVLGDWHPQPKFYDLANTNAFGHPDQVFIPFSTAVDQQIASIGSVNCGSKSPGSDFAGLLTSNCAWVAYMVELDTAAQKQAYLHYLDSYASEQHGIGRFDWPPNNRLYSLPAWMDLMGVVPPLLKAFVVLAFCLLLVCMINAEALLLARFLGRSGEIGVRRAIGATRTAIAMQSAIEAAIVGLVGGVAGLLFTGLGIVWLQFALPVQIASLTRVDLALLVQAELLAVVATVAAGLYPVLRSARVSPALHLKG